MEGSHSINTYRAGKYNDVATGRDAAGAENILHGHIKWLHCVVKVPCGEEECVTVNFTCS